MNKLTSNMFKLIAAAAALGACAYAVLVYWDRIVRYVDAGRKLYLHERQIRGHAFRSTDRDDYADLDWDSTAI